MPHRIVPALKLLLRPAFDIGSNMASTGGAVWAIIGAIDANVVQLWGGVLVALLAALWGLVREQRRHDFDDEERRKLLKVLVDANEAAILAKQPLPFPEIVTLLVRQRGIEEKKEPASG